MEALSDGDVRSMLDFLHEASEVDGPDAFTEPVVAAFTQLIPADAGSACIAVAGAVPGVAPEARTMLSFSHLDSEWCANIQTPWTEEFEEICRHYIEQDLVPPRPQHVNRVVRASDVLSRRDRDKLEIYKLIDNGVEDSLQVWLSAENDVWRRIQFCSGRPGGVSDRDVRVLGLLVPHLDRLYRRAAARRSALPVLGDLSAREHEVVSLVARGQTNREIARALWISPNTVRKHLENIFEKLGVTNRTAAARALSALSRREIGGVSEQEHQAGAE